MIWRPFILPNDFFIEVYNESFLLLLFSSLHAFSDYVDDVDLQYEYGFYVVGLILLCILINFGIFFSTVISQILQALTRKLKPLFEKLKKKLNQLRMERQKRNLLKQNKLNGFDHKQQTNFWQTECQDFTFNSSIHSHTLYNHQSEDFSFINANEKNAMRMPNQQMPEAVSQQDQDINKATQGETSFFQLKLKPLTDAERRFEDRVLQRIQGLKRNKIEGKESQGDEDVLFQHNSLVQSMMHSRGLKSQKIKSKKQNNELAISTIINTDHQSKQENHKDHTESNLFASQQNDGFFKMKQKVKAIEKKKLWGEIKDRANSQIFQLT